MIKPIQITVGAGGSNPSPGSTVWNDPTLAGQDGYLSRAGFGPLPYDAYTVLPAGGVQLLGSYVFGLAGEVYFWQPVSVTYPTEWNNTAPLTDYTNGFNYNRVINALIGRIGFRAALNKDGIDIVDFTNQASRSKRYYDDFHALTTAKNLYETQPDSSITIVDFNKYLNTLQTSTIMRSLNAVFGDKEMLEQGMVLDIEEGAVPQAVLNTDLFVGYKIEVPDDPTIALQINSMQLLLDSDVNDLPVYLFKAGKKSPVWFTTVDIKANENTVVSLEDVVLNYLGSNTKGGGFYFGYFQTDLGTAKAIRLPIEMEDVYNYEIQAITAKRTGSPDFDRTVISETWNSYGLNLEISVFRDWTATIVNRPNLFDELNGLSMVATVLETILYSVRSNKNERILKAGLTEAVLVQDLTGTAPVSDGPPPVLGIRQRIEREAKRVRDSVTTEPPKNFNINLAEC